MMRREKPVPVSLRHLLGNTSKISGALAACERHVDADHPYFNSVTQPSSAFLPLIANRGPLLFVAHVRGMDKDEYYGGFQALTHTGVDGAVVTSPPTFLFSSAASGGEVCIFPSVNGVSFTQSLDGFSFGDISNPAMSFKLHSADQIQRLGSIGDLKIEGVDESYLGWSSFWPAEPANKKWNYAIDHLYVFPVTSSQSMFPRLRSAAAPTNHHIRLSHTTGLTFDEELFNLLSAFLLQFPNGVLKIPVYGPRYAGKSAWLKCAISVLRKRLFDIKAQPTQTYREYPAGTKYPFNRLKFVDTPGYTKDDAACASSEFVALMEGRIKSGWKSQRDGAPLAGLREDTQRTINDLPHATIQVMSCEQVDDIKTPSATALRICNAAHRDVQPFRGGPFFNVPTESVVSKVDALLMAPGVEGDEEDIFKLHGGDLAIAQKLMRTPPPKVSRCFTRAGVAMDTHFGAITPAGFNNHAFNPNDQNCPRVQLIEHTLLQVVRNAILCYQLMHPQLEVSHPEAVDVAPLLPRAESEASSVATVSSPW